MNSFTRLVRSPAARSLSVRSLSRASKRWEPGALAEKLAQRPQVSVSMQSLLDTAMGLNRHRVPGARKDTSMPVEMQVARFLHRELPVRFAHRIVELKNLPHGLANEESVVTVREWYEQSLLDIYHHDMILEDADEQRFRETIDRVYARHAATLETMAQGIQEFKGSISGRPLHEFSDIHSFLDRFYLSRIGIRMLIGQYLAIAAEADGGSSSSPFSGGGGGDDGMVVRTKSSKQGRMRVTERSQIGLIKRDSCPYTIAQHAIDEARYVCAREFGEAPEVVIRGNQDRTFAYVPSHLHYMLFELLKNSLRAVYEKHGESVEGMPPVEVIIADGKDNEDVVIKIADEGGGIRRSSQANIFSYLFTTADLDIEKALLEDDFDRNSPMAGFGYGLPIARLYARYFGGDLNIMSMEGFGTDAFIYLSRLTNNKEPLA